jgi:hypothetical protein
MGRGWLRRRDSTWWRETVLAAGVGAVLLATWFGWSLTIYGAKGTFLTNTSVTDNAQSTAAQLWIAVLNVRDTFVPHFLRDVDYQFIAQQSTWGWWRDWFFQLYQVNFLFVFGSINWVAVASVLVTIGKDATPRRRAAWALAIMSAVTLGIIVHSGRDEWGLAHICLQPLVLLGLTLLASHWESLHSVWRRTIVAGATLDVALGITLHFGAQSFLLDQWLAPERSATETLFSYSPHAAANLRAKIHHQWVFFGDSLAVHGTELLLFLCAVLLLALVRANKRESHA